MFYPFVTNGQRDAVQKTLCSRFVGQGPQVDEFEAKFCQKFGIPFALAVNSGSAALETACDLLDLKPGDKVITTPLTCTATNLPLIRRGVKLLWADINPETLNISNESVKGLVELNPDVAAIMNVHLGGIESNLEVFAKLEDHGAMIIPVPVIDDASQAVGIYRGEADFTTYSFQAIKHFTTGDGGMIGMNHEPSYKQAKLLRWFGIDREKKKANDWQAFKEREMLFDIEVMGHKRHMNDIAASMGIKGLEAYDSILEKRKKIFDIYRKIKAPGFKLIDPDVRNVYWLATALVENREDFVKKLHDYRIETNLVQIRNDIYKVFGGVRQNLPNMNELENKYVSIPLQNVMSLEDAEYIKDVIEEGWN
jgi:dTDP-4-amino-4,6-dideoxygalactose transaminase